MRTQHSFVKSMLLSVLILLQMGFAYEAADDYKKTVKLNPGSLIILENVNGSIEIEGWNKEEVSIEAHKVVKSDDREKAEEYLKAIQIEVQEENSTLRINTRKGTTNNGLFEDGNPVNINYKLKVPLRSDLQVSSTNGGIAVLRIEGKLELHTTNGRIKADEISGNVNANTTNGSLSVNFRNVKTDDNMEFHTTNGSIDLQIPESIQCDLQAKTSNGTITTDFPLEIKGKYNSKQVDAKINGGGGRLDLKTTNGRISIEKI
ncbi:MAG: DUF4097 family beta strand repeat-containing protein [Calditrichia bacterium]